MQPHLATLFIRLPTNALLCLPTLQLLLHSFSLVRVFIRVPSRLHAMPRCGLPPLVNPLCVRIQTDVNDLWMWQETGAHGTWKCAFATCPKPRDSGQWSLATLPLVAPLLLLLPLLLLPPPPLLLPPPLPLLLPPLLLLPQPATWFVSLPLRSLKSG